MLAGVLLKMGGYGMVRLMIPLLPDACAQFAWLMILLSVIAVVYASLVALAQEDMKKLIAYSSVAHMGFVTAGLFTFETLGAQGAVFQMLSHGLVSAALFICVGCLQKRGNTRQIDAFEGVAPQMPMFGVFAMIFTLATIGVPGTSGFIGEVMVLMGLFQVSGMFSWMLGLSLVLGAGYSLWLYKRVFFGKTNQLVQQFRDLKKHELAALGVLGVSVLFLGIYPRPALNMIGPAVEEMQQKFRAGLKDKSKAAAHFVSYGSQGRAKIGAGEIRSQTSRSQQREW